MNPRLIARFLGILLVVEAFFMATSIIWGIIDSDAQAIANFGIATTATALVALVLILIGRSSSDIIHPRDAVVTVTVGWILVTAFGAVPYLLEGAFDHIADAFFEAASGFTTTGASVMTDIEQFSRSLLWWRSLTHWIGGMGIIVLFIAILPRMGIGAVRLFRFEVSGTITQRLHPKLRQTAMILWAIYIGLTLAEAIALTVSGLSVFDALCHSFATLASGGFSTLNGSIAGFNSLAVEIIVIIFMFSAGVNFTLYYRALSGDRGAFWRDAEFRAYTVIMVLACVLVTLTILPDKASIAEALRCATFQVVSLQSTTGFVTDDFDRYPAFARLVLVGLMFVNACGGSTAGGIKVARHLILWRGVYGAIVKSFRPSAVVATRIGEVAVDRDTLMSVCLFFACYLGLFFVGSLFLTMTGVDILSAATGVATCMANTGPGLGLVGPMQNFSAVPIAGKVALSILMILGRLEIMTMLALLIPSFWRR